MIVTIECLAGTKEKYEAYPMPNGTTEYLLDRILKRKWLANYGYVPSTLQADNQPLDVYVIGQADHSGQELDVFPIAIIYSRDNKQTDNKLICVTAEANTRGIVKKVRKIAKFITKYKANSTVSKISWKEADIQLEIDKAKSFYKLFKGG